MKKVMLTFVLNLIVYEWVESIIISRVILFSECFDIFELNRPFYGLNELISLILVQLWYYIM